MSFNIFLINFHNGEPFPFPFSLFQKSFGSYCSDQTGDCWRLDYPDGGWCDIDGEPMDGFGVS
ncbi:hypothetical protein [Methylocystis heyeri]|uniref:Uncharacterized protein n=1 Tax=Methylocystis heyeri TaxID=391905 RepID=A0A6B8KHG6_9HYPH|nr:hypothetical protein [Methylocystis heyeri]QGM46451.1 hypothetical protein H2LOC_012520 [Methylocystis heyeri]